MDRGLCKNYKISIFHDTFYHQIVFKLSEVAWVRY